jgi:hypothetical protein
VAWVSGEDVLKKAGELIMDDLHHSLVPATVKPVVHRNLL